MAVVLEQFITQIVASGLIPTDVLDTFVPPAANPKDAEALARELIRQKHLTKFQAEEISRGKGKSLTLGNYVLLEKIGQGGMGAVFKAEHRRMKRLVAIKMLPATMINDAAAADRFQREVEAAAKLRHPNIIAADDADEAGGIRFLVMEYVEGQDLSALVKKNGPRPVDEAVDYIIQAARGLEYAHQCGVIHRDIKPSNLLVDARKTVKILDMGLARIQGITGPQAELTGTGIVMGTVDYMAPEQALSTKNADARSDVYSLGISLWYLLTARCLYDGDSMMAKLLAHREASIPSLPKNCNAPASLDAVFQKMVAKKPADRYQTMTDVLADLEACQRGDENRLPTVRVPSANVTKTSVDAHGATLVKRKSSSSTVSNKLTIDETAPTVVSSASEVATDPALPEFTEKKQKRRTKRSLSRGLRWPMLAGPVMGILAIGVMLAVFINPAKRGVPDSKSGSGQEPRSASKESTLITARPTEDLLRVIDPDRDAIEGIWSRDGADLISPVQAYGQIGISTKRSEEYRLVLDVTRLSGVGPLVIGLPIGPSRCVAVLDREPDTHRSRLEQVPVGPNTQSAVASSTSGLPLDGRTNIECRVGRDSVEVIMDGKSILKFAGDPSMLKTPGGWQVDDVGRVFLGATFSKFRIHKLAMEPLTH